MSKSKVAGWVLSLLLALILIVPSAGGKFTHWDGKSEMFGKLGWSEDVMYIIGIVEVLVAVLFLIPHTAFVGAILVTAYLGGAVATHVRISDSSYFPMFWASLPGWHWDCAFHVSLNSHFVGPERVGKNDAASLRQHKSFRGAKGDYLPGLFFPRP